MCFDFRLVLESVRIDLLQGSYRVMPGALHDVTVRYVLRVQIGTAEMTKVMETEWFNMILPEHPTEFL